MINDKLIDVFLQNAEQEDLIRGIKQILNHLKIENSYNYEEVLNNIVNIIGGDKLTTIEDIDILSHFFDVMIISDIRFPIEITGIKEKFDDVVVINVKRINFETELTAEQQSHKTETALDGFNDYDYCLINDTLEGLERDVKEIVHKEEEHGKTNK